MRQEMSPFLHRESKRKDAYEQQKRTYAERIIPSHDAQRAKIEMFRYRWYQRNGTLGSVMQALGDFGRAGGWAIIPLAAYFGYYVVGRFL